MEIVAGREDESSGRREGRKEGGSWKEGMKEGRGFMEGRNEGGEISKIWQKGRKL